MTRRRAPLWRRLLSWLCLLVFCLAAPLTLASGWAWLVLSNTETYTLVAQDVADDPRVQAGLAALVGQHAAAVVAGENPTATAAVQARVVAAALGEVTADVIDSDEFQAIWTEANRQAHAFLFSRLGAGWGQPVTLDLSPLTPRVQAEIDALDLAVDVSLGPDDLRLDLLNAEYADQIRRVVAQITGLFWGSLATGLAALILSIALAPDRLAAAARAAFGLAISMIALIAGLLVAQAMARNTVGAGGEALGAISDAISQGLRVSAIGLTLAGLLLAGLFGGLATLRRSTARRAVAG